MVFFLLKLKKKYIVHSMPERDGKTSENPPQGNVNQKKVIADKYKLQRK